MDCRVACDDCGGWRGDNCSSCNWCRCDGCLVRVRVHNRLGLDFARVAVTCVVSGAHLLSSHLRKVDWRALAFETRRVEVEEKRVSSCVLTTVVGFWWTTWCEWTTGTLATTAAGAAAAYKTLRFGRASDAPTATSATSKRQTIDFIILLLVLDERI